MILVGEILKPHGIRGSIKIRPFMDAPDSFFGIRKIKVDGREFEIEKASAFGSEFLLLKVKGIDDMTSAEALRGKKIFVERENMPEIADGRYYIADLIGLTVKKESGEILGRIDDVLQYGSADVIVVKGKTQKIMFPFIKNVDREINFADKTFTVSDKVFTEVAVYED